MALGQKILHIIIYIYHICFPLNNIGLTQAKCGIRANVFNNVALQETSLRMAVILLFYYRKQ